MIGYIKKSFAYFPESITVSIYPKQFKRNFGRFRYLFLFNLMSFGKPRQRNKTWYIITIGLLYFETSWRIGNGSNPFWIRNENLYWHYLQKKRKKY